MSRAREDDSFRLAFTLLVLDRYPDLFESASTLAPTIDTHAVVIEAVRMVDEAAPAVDSTTGHVARVVPRAEWLADWVQEAIRVIARSPSAQAVRLGRRRPGWEAEHAERQELLGRLSGLGSSRDPAVLTLLGWDDHDAVAALAGHGDAAVGVSVEGYRALAGEGLARLRRIYGDAASDAGNAGPATLVQRLERVMPGLAWVVRPDVERPLDERATGTPIDIADVVALGGGPSKVEEEPAAVTSPDPAIDSHLAEVDHPVADSVPAGDAPVFAWSADDLVPLDGELDGAPEGREGAGERVAWPEAAAAGGGRGRLLVLVSVVAAVAVGAGALVALRPQGGQVRVGPTADATARDTATKTAPARPKRADAPQRPARVARSRATSKPRPATPKAATVRRSTTVAVTVRSRPRPVAIAPQRRSYAPARRAAPVRVTATMIDREFLP